VTESDQREIGAIDSTVVSLLRTRASKQPGQVAYTFAAEHSGRQDVTYAELDRKAASIACLLSDLGLRGRLAMLLYPPGLDYVAAFFGCLYAGAIAVPACPPDPLRPDRSLSRLVAVAEDARPSAVLTTASAGSGLLALLGSVPGLSHLPVVATDRAPAWACPDAGPVRISAESIALVQYTSGSTSAPKGVVLTHQNLMSNSALLHRLFGHSPESRGVCWVPLYHDMGLIGGILQPLYGGFPVTFMPAADFLRRPLSWLEEISRTGATTSGGPNFTYELCLRKTTQEERARLDLSRWRVAFNGAEPVRAETMEKFARAFRVAGFRREAFHPCYGLAESALIVTGGLPWSRQRATAFDAESLRSGAAVAPVAGRQSRRLVSSGWPALDHRVLIVDPATQEERAAGQVGEIWISGPSVAQSYWGRPAQTRETFGARLARTGEGPFLRSGDLGFKVGRKVFVTGRIKDLIVVRGYNHYPQDLELAAERAHPALRPGCAAAFTAPAFTAADGDRERLVIAIEVSRHARPSDFPEIASAIRTAVAAQHELQVHTVVLLPPGGIPKTTGGKIQRSLCATRLEAGHLTELSRDAIGGSCDGLRRVERASLLTAPRETRRRLLCEYLGSLIASACGLAPERVTDMPLLALGIDSYAAVSIQHAIRSDLQAHVTASDLAYAASVADLAARLDEQLTASPELSPDAEPSQDLALAPPPEQHTADQDLVRVYCWTGGSRVPVHAASAPDPAARARPREGKRPMRAS
jgi:acyl-CoA synthetase (AMP-forming)/AMP-acid ligase II